MYANRKSRNFLEYEAFHLEKQCFACLSSHFAYGETIHEEAPGTAGRIVLIGFGGPVRTRIHRTIAHIEILLKGFKRLP